MDTEYIPKQTAQALIEALQEAQFVMMTLSKTLDKAAQTITEKVKNTGIEVVEI